MKKLLIVHIIAVAIIILAAVQLLNGTAYATTYPNCLGYCQCGTGTSICNGDPTCLSSIQDKFPCMYGGIQMKCLEFCCDHQPCWSR